MIAFDHLSLDHVRVEQRVVDLLLTIVKMQRTRHVVVVVVAVATDRDRLEAQQLLAAIDLVATAATATVHAMLEHVFLVILL